MKNNFMKKFFTIIFISTLTFSLIGCDFLDELLEPEQKTYSGTIYNQTDKKDRDFNEYDGEIVEENDEENKDNEDSENILTQQSEETKKGAYYFDFEETKQYTISEVEDNGYTIAFTMPNEFIDFTKISQIKKPKKQLINLKKNSWSGSFYRYMGTDNQKIKIITAIYSLDKFSSIDDMATMEPGVYKKFQTDAKTSSIQEGNLLQLVVNGYTPVSYRIYPYETETGKSALIMSAAQIGEKYMYTEFWIDDVFEEVNYEDLIVHIFSSAICTESENVVFE